MIVWKAEQMSNIVTLHLTNFTFSLESVLFSHNILYSQWSFGFAGCCVIIYYVNYLWQSLVVQGIMVVSNREEIVKLCSLPFDICWWITQMFKSDIVETDENGDIETEKTDIIEYYNYCNQEVISITPPYVLWYIVQPQVIKTLAWNLHSTDRGPKIFKHPSST